MDVNDVKNKIIACMRLACEEVEDPKPILKYLTKQFGFTNDDITMQNNVVFMTACKFSQFEVAYWLIHKFQLEDDVVRMNNNLAFRYACMNGDLEFAKMLSEFFEFTRVEATDDDNDNYDNADHEQGNDTSAIALSCESGHLYIAQWLVKEFSLTKDDVITHERNAFLLACQNGHLEIVQWLVKEFSLTKDDVITLERNALLPACQYGHFKIVKWLVTTFDLNAQDHFFCYLDDPLNACFTMQHWNIGKLASKLFPNHCTSIEVLQESTSSLAM